MSFPRYLEYRDSGVEWLGEVPGHWDVLALKKSFQIIGGSTPKSDMESFWDGDILWATPSDLSKRDSVYMNDTQRKITAAGLASCGTTLVPARSIVLSTRAPIGSLAIADTEMCTNQGCKSLVPLENTSTEYFAYLLSISSTELNIHGKGTTFLELSGDELGAFKAPVPPLLEQTQIAAFLDRETAKIDALVAEQRRLMALLKEKRQAVISHAVTRGLNPNVPLKQSGIEWLGDVPEHWDVLSLRRCSLRVQTGGTPSSEPPSTDIEDGLVWYTPGDFGDSLRLTISDRKISRSVAESGEAKVFPPGCALIVSIGATLGKVGFSEAASSGNQQINAVIPNNRIDGYFLTYSLLVKTEVMRFLSNASTIGIMNQEKTKEIWLSVPPRHEQEKITAYLDTELAKFDTLTTEAQRAIDLLQERRTTLISAAVTGHIDVRESVS